jgi:uncharacterized protein (DUF58 family)
MIVLTFVAVIVLSNLGWGLLAMLVLGVMVGITIAAGWFWIWLRGIDVSNNLRQFVVPVLALFREDIDPKTPVHIRLDLSKPTTSQKKTTESAPYKAGVPQGRDRCTSIRGCRPRRCSWTTRLKWSVTDHSRRKKTKRNARGKYRRR